MSRSFEPSLPARAEPRFAAENLPQALAIALERSPPGVNAQREFEPELSFGRHVGPPMHDARRATVMVLIYPGPTGWELPLIVRPTTMSSHAGQVSLPGGSVDPGETTRLAAVRELQEELGVDPHQVRLLGQLSPLYLYNSNFVISPWIGWTTARPTWRASPHEVAELLEVPLVWLADPARRGRHQRSHMGIRATAPHIQIGRHRVWGATSMILGELLAVLNQLEISPDAPPASPG